MKIIKYKLTTFSILWILILTSCTKFESVSLISSGDGTSVDTLAPPAPTFLSPIISSTVASVNLDVSGLCEDGAIITLTGNILNSPVTDVCTNSGFSKSVILSSANGLKTVYASQLDASNNVSVISSITITLDINAPAAPTIASPLSGILVSSFAQTVSGECETGSTVSISGSIASSPVTALCVSSAYSRSVTLSANNGLKSINVMQVDLNGNASASRSIMITFDNIAPAMPTVTSPSSGSIVGGLAQTLIGGCETGATLSLSGSIVGSPVTVLCANSTYSRPVTLSTGSGLKTINLIQTDLAGNVSPNRTYTISVDTTAPLAPTITSPVNGSTVGVVAQTVVGSCEQGAVVHLSGPFSGSPLTLFCNGSAYSKAVTLTSINELKTMSVFQTDSANNMSTSSQISITLDTSGGGTNPPPSEIMLASVSYGGFRSVSKESDLSLMSKIYDIPRSLLDASAPSCMSPQATIIGGKCCINNSNLDCYGSGGHSDFLYRGVAFGAGRFVAVGGWSHGIVSSSTNGITWSKKTDLHSSLNLVTGTNKSAGWLSDITFGKNIFVATSGAGYLFTSSDGLNWNSISASAGGGSLRKIIFTGIGFLATGDSAFWAYSADGRSWQTSGYLPIPNDDRINSRVHTLATNQQSVLGIINSVGGNTRVFQMNLANMSLGWKEVAAVPGNVDSLVYVSEEKKFIAFGKNIIYLSTDGTTWSTESTSLSVFPSNVAYEYGIFFTTSTDSENCLVVHRSKDITNWQSQKYCNDSLGNYNVRAIAIGAR